MRYNTDTFIEKASEIHNKYDYSKIDFKNVNTKVTIICPIHGEFEQLPYNHLKGQGCRKCRRESLRELQKQGKGPWSKAARKKAADTMEEKFGAKTWSNSNEGKKAMSTYLQDKIIASKMEHGTINDSQPERDAYALLIHKFGKDDNTAASLKQVSV